ncbi:MAG: 50S ribosomal protein L11 methyltransferase [Runella sp.]
MPAQYLETSLTLHPDFNEILMAELAEIGYESFVETDEGLLAYIQKEHFDESQILALIERYQHLTPIVHSSVLLENKNWNEEWERNYQPIEVANKIRVRASYHTPNPDFEYEMVIDPKMSFGTGHHETTTLVMELQLGLGHAQKSVLDVGSGTGILAILAEKLGAVRLTAFDIEEWAYLNAVENAALNGCQRIHFFQGTIADCPPDEYDIVLANINRNILLQEIPIYNTYLKTGGTLIVSGFYEFDAPDIIQKAKDVGLESVVQKSLNQWTAIEFYKV